MANLRSLLLSRNLHSTEWNPYIALSRVSSNLWRKHKVFCLQMFCVAYASPFSQKLYIFTFQLCLCSYSTLYSTVKQNVSRFLCLCCCCCCQRYDFLGLR